MFFTALDIEISNLLQLTFTFLAFGRTQFVEMFQLFFFFDQDLLNILLILAQFFEFSFEMDDAFTDNVVALAETDWFVAFFYEYLLNVFKLVAQLLLLGLLSFDLSRERLVFSILFEYLVASAGNTLLGLSNQLHHSLNFRDQDVLLLLLCLSVFIFTLNFGVFELADFSLEGLVSVIDLRSLFLSLLKLLFKGLQFVLMFFLLLLSLFQLESL